MAICWTVAWLVLEKDAEDSQLLSRDPQTDSGQTVVDVLSPPIIIPSSAAVTNNEFPLVSL